MKFRTLFFIFDDTAESACGKAKGLYALLIAGNLAVLDWALIEFRHQPTLLGLAFLAYSLGLRHAFDADHIAAIDNVTRHLMQRGRQPIAAGFFFSLGHSTIVFGLTVAIALATTTLQGDFASLKAIGATVGASISSLVLFATAMANIVTLIQTYRAFRAAKGVTFRGQDGDVDFLQGGLLGRAFRSTFRLVARSWHMYPLGLLFGLGFDTATEVGLLGISAGEASQGFSFGSILVFPALFAAGMSLLDTTDSTIMVGAYGWAFMNPVRKLCYNMTVTLVSVVAAVVIGGIEVLGLLQAKLGLQGPFWHFVGLFSDNLDLFGYGIVAIFVASWIAFVLVHKASRPAASA